MKHSRRLTAYFLICLMMLCAALPVSATGQPIQTDAPCILTISYIMDETPLTGAQFHVYRVAEVSETGTLTPIGDFAEYSLDLNALNESQPADLAVTLQSYAHRDQIAADAQLIIDETGTATAENLSTGLYLIASSRKVTESGVYVCVPMLVSLPVEDTDGSWNYLLTVQPKASFEPKRETVDRKILKVWNDATMEYKRPVSIEIALLRNGRPYEIIELTARDNWRHTWSGLDASYEWTIVEKPVEGYTATHTTEGITTVITNTPDDPEPDPTTPTYPPEPELPKTGMLWWPVPLLVILGMVLILAGVVIKRGDRYEA